jgi:hypothetical protein
MHIGLVLSPIAFLIILFFIASIANGLYTVFFFENSLHPFEMVLIAIALVSLPSLLIFALPLQQRDMEY